MLEYTRPVLTFIFFLLIISAKIQSITARELWAFNNLFSNNDNDWKGRWFPYSPEENVDNNPVVNYGKEDLYDPKHGMAMGVIDPKCDDAKSNLYVDWNFNPLNYTCYELERKSLYKPRSDVQPIYSISHIPRGYSAPHRCMNLSIEYDTLIPTFGTHRPLWAKYGEYTFLPRQRWVHNLEHGAVVMLYHPCADKNEIKLLKNLVSKCLYRHIITPYNLLPPERPLALVAWGRRLEISKVAPEIVLDFIKKNALNGPEQTARDGQYSLMLEKHANIVSNIDDSSLCKVFE